MAGDERGYRARKTPHRSLAAAGGTEGPGVFYAGFRDQLKAARATGAVDTSADNVGAHRYEVTPAGTAGRGRQPTATSRTPRRDGHLCRPAPAYPLGCLALPVCCLGSK